MTSGAKIQKFTLIEPVTFRYMIEIITAERDSELHHKGGPSGVVTIP